MSISRALAILGAGASGYQGGQEQARQRSRQEEDDAFRREQRDRQRTDWQRKDQEYERQQADQAAERAAMAPTEMKPELAPDQQGPQAFQVAGKTIADPAAAEAATQAYNAPQAGMRRAAGAVRDPMRAAELQGRANQTEMGGIQLDEARAAQAAAAWDREMTDAIVGSLKTVSDPAKAVDFMNKSAADGMGGKSKWAHKVEGDSITFYPVGPDGTALNNGWTGPNTPQGRMQLAMMLSKKTPIGDKLKDLRDQQKADFDRQDKKSDNERQDRQQASTERYQQGMLDVQRGELGIRSNEARLRRAALDAEAKIPPAVKMQYASIDKELATLNSAITKAQAEGQFDPKSPQAQALMLRQRELTTTAQRILQPYIGDGGGAASSGDPLGLFGDKPQANDKMAAVKADMAKSGTTGANFDIGGVKGSIGTPSRPVPQPRMQSAAAAPGSGGDPLKGLSRQKVREKRGEIAAEIKRWEGDPNAKARIDELRTLLERIDNGQY